MAPFVCSKISRPVELVVGEGVVGIVVLIHAEILVGVCCGDKRLLLHVVGDPTDAWEAGDCDVLGDPEGGAVRADVGALLRGALSVRDDCRFVSHEGAHESEGATGVARRRGEDGLGQAGGGVGEQVIVVRVLEDGLGDAVLVREALVVVLGLSEEGDRGVGVGAVVGGDGGA